MNESRADNASGIYTGQKEKRESIYDSIERKVGTLKDLWNLTQALPIPTKDDPQDALLQDSALFDPFLERVKSFTPEAAEKYKKYEDWLKKSASNSKKRQPWETDESNQVPDDPDIRFILSIQKGTAALLKRREQIRETYREAGDDWLNTDNYPKIRATALGIKDVQVTRVIPQRFSTALEVRYTKYSKEASHNGGFHTRGSAFTIVRQPRYSLEKSIFGQATPEDIEKENRIQIALAHEDFHSFLEAFIVPESEFISDPQTILARLSRSSNNLAILPSFFRKAELKKCKKELDKLVNSGQGELLAEIASIEHRDIPQSTFARILGKTIPEFLEKLKGKDPEMDKLIGDVLDEFNLDKVRSTIKNLYQKVEEKSPERRQDLDIAFALFPPTEIRHIERLVNRWVS